MEIGKEEPKGKGIGLLIGIKGPSASKESTDDNAVAGEDAAQELLDAIEKKDAKAVYEAMCSLCEICDSDDGEESEPKDEEAK
jgi:hypothetical protein